MRRVGRGLVACVLMLAGCGGAGVVQGRVSPKPGCGHVTADEKAAVFFETYRSGRPSDQIVLVRPDGQSIPVAAGQLTVP